MAGVPGRGHEKCKCPEARVSGILEEQQKKTVWLENWEQRGLWQEIKKYEVVEEARCQNL